MLADDIRNLDDDEARRLLAAIARGRDATADNGHAEGLDAEEVRELAGAFGVDPEAVGKVSEGELARRALIALAESDDSGLRASIEAMVEGPRAEALSVLSTTVILAGVLLALQTHGVVGRDKDGKFYFKFEKKPTTDALLRPVIEALLGVLGRRP